ncbi:MAG: translation initiation factor IF-2 subunit gamma [Candidatus Anstonellales archaeon]
MQPNLNIGFLGHVDHGKTSLTFALTGKWTDTHSEEIKRGISIRLGYSEYSAYRCYSCGNYQANNSKCQKCNSDMQFLRKISVLDSPGHETLMATTIACGNLLDGAVLVIAANEECPQTQTQEHLMVLKILGIKHIVVVQNKVDIVSKDQAIKNYNQIRNFLSMNDYDPNTIPIIPVAASLKVNINRLVEAIEKYIPTLTRDPTKELLMYIARSFDINKPGDNVLELKGGVIGGSISSGMLSENEEIEILPMPKDYGKDSEILKVVSLYTGNERLKTAYPGGLIAIQTDLDPYWTKSDSMIGSIISRPGKGPLLYDKITIEYNQIKRVDIQKENSAFLENEVVVVNAGTATAVGTVKAIKKNKITIELKNRIAIAENSIISISRRIKQRWRLSGYGNLSMDY